MKGDYRGLRAPRVKCVVRREILRGLSGRFSRARVASDGQEKGSPSILGERE